MAQSRSGTKVAVVGPTGTLGPPVIKHLLERDFDLTLITRDAKRAAEKLNPILASGGGARIEEADFSSSTSLVPLLSSYQVVVILINRDQVDAQITVIDAAIEAGVGHIIPSSFGIDTRRPEVRANPGMATKIRAEDHLFSEIRDSGGKTSYTAIQTGIFLDWALRIGFLVNAIGKGDQPTMRFDQGNVMFSATTLDDIGTAVATAVERRGEEGFKNKMLLMHTIAATQDDYLSAARELQPGKPWPVIQVDTAEVGKKSQEAWDNGIVNDEVFRGFFMRNTFGLGLGLLDNVDNDILGVPQRDIADLRELIGGFL